MPSCPHDREIRRFAPAVAAPTLCAEQPSVAGRRGIWLRRRRDAGIGNLLRLGAVAVGTLAVLVYPGDRLTRIAGAATHQEAAPGHQAAPVAEEGSRQRATRPSDPVERALNYLDRAKAGDPVAQYNIALLYARGDGLLRDHAAAGAILGRGQRAPQDVVEAFAWYHRAAERDHPAAQYNLGVAYAVGRGTPRDPAAAARWYRLAAEKGVIAAMVNIAILHEIGEGVARSPPEAYAWYRAAARRGDGAAEQRAAELFRQFSGPEKGQAVLLAAAIVEALHEPPAAPAQSSPKPDGPDAAPALPERDASVGLP